MPGSGRVQDRFLRAGTFGGKRFVVFQTFGEDEARPPLEEIFVLHPLRPQDRTSSKAGLMDIPWTFWKICPSVR